MRGENWNVKFNLGAEDHNLEVCYSLVTSRLGYSPVLGNYLVMEVVPFLG